MKVLSRMIEGLTSNEPWASYAIQDKQDQIDQLQYEIDQIRRVQNGEINRFGRRRSK